MDVRRRLGATKENLDYFYKVLNLKRRKYRKLEVSEILCSLRTVPFQRTWPCAILKTNSRLVDSTCINFKTQTVAKLATCNTLETRLPGGEYAPLYGFCRQNTGYYKNS